MLLLKARYKASARLFHYDKNRERSVLLWRLKYELVFFGWFFTFAPRCQMCSLSSLAERLAVIENHGQQPNSRIFQVKSFLNKWPGQTPKQFWKTNSPVFSAFNVKGNTMAVQEKKWSLGHLWTDKTLFHFIFCIEGKIALFLVIIPLWNYNKC